MTPGTGHCPLKQSSWKIQKQLERAPPARDTRALFYDIDNVDFLSSSSLGRKWGGCCCFFPLTFSVLPQTEPGLCGDGGAFDWLVACCSILTPYPWQFIFSLCCCSSCFLLHLFQGLHILPGPVRNREHDTCVCFMFPSVCVIQVLADEECSV